MNNGIANKIEDGFVGSIKGIASTIPGVSIIMSAVSEMRTGIFKQRLEDWQRLVDESTKWNFCYRHAYICPAVT